MSNPAITRDICGTRPGYWKHGKMGELKCDECRQANTLHRNELKGTRPMMSIDEVIAEIEWMLHLNQGSARILQAVGYVGRENSLATRLQRRGRGDLYRQALMIEQAAA